MIALADGHFAPSAPTAALPAPMPILATTVRVIVILLAIAGVAGQVVYLDATVWNAFGLSWIPARPVGSPTVFVLTAHALVDAVAALLAVALVLAEHHRQEASRALGIAFASWSYLLAYSGVTMLFRPVAPGLEREVFEAHFLVVEFVGLMALIRFTSIFPRPLHADELHPSPTLPRALRPIHRLGVATRRPGVLVGVSFGAIALLWVWAALRSGRLSDAGLSPLADIARFLAAGLVVMNLVQAWKVATEGDRDRLVWLVVSLACLLASVAVVIGGNVLLAAAGIPEPELPWERLLLDAGSVGFLWAIAMSVLGKGRIEPAALARRIVGVAAAATLCLFIGAGLESLFTGGALGSRSARTGVGTAIAFAIVLSTYRSLERLVDRILPV